VTVPVAEGEECSSGVCDPYCLPPPPPPPDAGVDAGPLRCAPARAIDLACDVDVVRAGEPTSIEVLVGGRDECYCGETIECRARVTGVGLLELETALCSDGLLCDGCYPFVEGTCELPALSEGSWRVDVNGMAGFELTVIDPGISVEWGEMCSRLGDAPLGVCAPAWPPVENVVDSACAPETVIAGSRVPIEITDSCGSACEATGPCSVSIFDDVIRVTPSTLQPSCDIACPAVCELRTEVCYTPPLPEGDWRVFLAGHDGPLLSIRSTDFGGGGEVLCVGIAAGG
jgi:hypothetical protein